jgi:hypothetical protein
MSNVNTTLHCLPSSYILSTWNVLCQQETYTNTCQTLIIHYIAYLRRLEESNGYKSHESVPALDKLDSSEGQAPHSLECSAHECAHKSFPKIWDSCEILDVDSSPPWIPRQWVDLSDLSPPRCESQRDPTAKGPCTWPGTWFRKMCDPHDLSQKWRRQGERRKAMHSRERFVNLFSFHSLIMRALPPKIKAFLHSIAEFTTVKTHLLYQQLLPHE